jgi:hypothetical protein
VAAIGFAKADTLSFELLAEASLQFLDPHHYVLIASEALTDYCQAFRLPLLSIYQHSTLHP